MLRLGLEAQTGRLAVDSESLAQALVDRLPGEYPTTISHVSLIFRQANHVELAVFVAHSAVHPTAEVRTSVQHLLRSVDPDAQWVCFAPDESTDVQAHGADPEPDDGSW